MKCCKKTAGLVWLIVMLLTMAGASFAQPNQYAGYPEYPGNDLGLTTLSGSWQLRIWAPTASAVEIRFYAKGLGGNPLSTQPMTSGEKGTWTATVPFRKQLLFYTVRAMINGQWQQEVVDPYARAVGANGVRAALLDAGSVKPEGWEADSLPAFVKPNDAVVYEAHIRDLGMGGGSGMKHKGKYLELTETGTRNSSGRATGLDHLKELGITHLHLLPVFDFATVDETRSGTSPYNWGYDPLNYNVPEGSYSSNAADPRARILEFRKMVQALHRNGIRLVMDVVYNHVHDAATSAFNQLVPGYYFRHEANGQLSNATACGNETASERPMMRKFMLESLLYWMREYHIDGFRFDLMGVHDIETMNLISQELHKWRPDILLYGEGWSAGASPLPDSLRALKTNAGKLQQIAIFSDDIRDGIKGSVFDAADRGFVSGKPGMETTIRFGVAASCPHPQIDYAGVNYSKAPYAAGPWNTVTYASCHDNNTLWDKLLLSCPESPEAGRKRMQLLGLSIVLTAQGIPFLHAGSEFFRSKQGVENSYQSGDSINAIDWSLKTIHAGAVQYVEKLIAMRRAHPAFRYPSASEIAAHVHFIDGLPSGVVGFLLDGQPVNDSWKNILVLYNARPQEQPVTLPAGDWSVFINGTDSAGILSANGSILVPAISCGIFYQE